MSIDIDKLLLNSNKQQELLEIQKLQSKRINSDDNVEDAVKKAKNADEKKDKKEAHLDTYHKSNAVSNSIEQQIKEQEAKIKELNKNLEGLRENYNETWEAEDVARTERYLKERERYRKEVTENSLKRIFANWSKKHFADVENESILKEYNNSNSKYTNATEERILADKAYDLADTEAFEAISAHNSSSAQFTAGLWGKRDAYWDLARLQRRLSIAKIMESRNQ